MDVIAVFLVTAAIFLWGVMSARLERADLTAPMVFVAIGALLGVLGVSTRRRRLRRSNLWWN